jgi:hypothetical protein
MMKKVTNGCYPRRPHPGLLPRGEGATRGEVRGGGAQRQGWDRIHRGAGLGPPR